MYPCPDGCPRTYSSIKAALLCDCNRFDENGHPKEERGTGWLD